MPAFPIRKYDHARLEFADHACNLEPIFPRVLHASIRNVQCIAPADFQNAGGGGGFSCAVFRCSARPHFAAGQIEYRRALPALRHLEQRSAAGLLYVIAVRRDSQHINWVR
jgi:hypothetical protein